MATSQNGWLASTDKTALGIVSPRIAGVTLPQGVRKGDVEIVLGYVAERFHATVEPLVPGHCWGYHYKVIEGSTQLSNHASGTAIDLNAPSHPMGKAGTFSAAKAKAIRAILADCDGVVRWGGDYSGRKDEMHFEIIKSAAEVAKVAAKLSGKPAPAPKPAAPAKLDEDGGLGPLTIRRWQQVMGTPADGTISTPSALVRAVQQHLNKAIKAGLVVDGVGIRADGRAYKTVRALQRYLGTPQDSKISVPVSTVVKALQRRLNTGRF